MSETPDQGDQRKKCERGGRQPGGKLRAAGGGVGADERDRSDGERQRRRANQHRQHAPEAEEHA